MSWFTRFANTISKAIVTSGEKGLPVAPSVMAAGSKWYGEIGPAKEEVINRIVNDVSKDIDIYDFINLGNIANDIVGNTDIGSYHNYLAYLHKDFVEDTKEVATSLHYEQHKKNVTFFFLITRLKIHLHRKITYMRNKKTQKKELEAQQNQAENEEFAESQS